MADEPKDEVKVVEVKKVASRRKSTPKKDGKKAPWHTHLVRGEKMKHHVNSKWFYILTALANIIGLLLIWTSLGADINNRWMGLNLILGVDSLFLAYVLLGKHKLVAPGNRRQLWASLVLNVIALLSINTSILAAVGFTDKALLAWPATLALLLGLWIEFDAWRDYNDFVESDEDISEDW